jgi:hypothetical protein
MLSENILLAIIIIININTFIIGYLLGRYCYLNGVTNNSSSSFFSQQKYSQPQKSINNIEIDDKKVVTKIKTEGLEKKYDSLGEIKQTSENINNSVDKLKNLKK